MGMVISRFSIFFAGSNAINKLNMLVRYRIPKTILWVANLFAIFLLIFTGFRLATFLAFRPGGFSFSDAIPSFWMGFRYDLRWIAVILLPIVLLSSQPRFSPFYSIKNKKWWTWYLAIITFIVFFFFAAGFGSFSYNRTPLDAGAMNFAEDLSSDLDAAGTGGGRTFFPVDVPPQSLAGDQPHRRERNSPPPQIFYCQQPVSYFSHLRFSQLAATQPGRQLPFQ
jgi:hypothetical protein